MPPVTFFIFSKFKLEKEFGETSLSLPLSVWIIKKSSFFPELAEIFIFYLLLLPERGTMALTAEKGRERHSKHMRKKGLWTKRHSDK